MKSNHNINKQFAFGKIYWYQKLQKGPKWRFKNFNRP